MDGRSPYRADLIPSGHCVDGEDSIVETFAQIDTNNSDMRKLALATAACKSCIQFEHCKNQIEGLATELWQRGVGLAVIGGDAHTTPTLERRDATKDRPAFLFNLERIPEDPTLALSMLRQGSRSGQFDVKGHTPTGIKDTAEQYLQHLEEKDPSFYQKLQEMGEEDLNKGFKYILTTLFQQKDYAVYSRGTRSGQQAKQRYNPERFDFKQDSEIVSLYFRDVIAIGELGLKKATTKAMRFEPAFYQELVESIGKDGLRLSTLDEIISGSSKTPMAALVKREARKEAFYDTDPDLSKSAAARLARSSAPAGVIAPVDTLSTKYQKLIPRHIVKAVCEQRPVSAEKSLDRIEQRIRIGQNRFGDSHPIVRQTEMASMALRYASAQEYLDALQEFYNNMTTLSDMFADSPEIWESDLRSFSELPLEKGVEAAKNFLDKLDHLRRIAGGTIPDGILHEEARKGTTSIMTLRHNYDRRLISNRVRVRAKSHNEIPPSPGLIDRITTLYPSFEQSAVTDTVYDLINNEQLVMARADAVAVASNMTESLTRILTPEPRQYLTFRSELAALTPVERLTFAHYHNLMPLLYGRTASPLLLEAFVNTDSLRQYYEQTLQARVNDLCQDKPAGTFGLMQLEADLQVFDTMLKTAVDQPLPQENNRLVIRGLRDTQIVIGGKALHLNEPDYNWNWPAETPDFADWLQTKITETYPPHQQERAMKYAEEACAQGVLELMGNTPSEYRLVFSKSFYSNNVTELERESIANAMGLDRLVYGSDLTTALAHRLGKAI